MAEIKKLATREGYGQGLIELGKTRKDVIVLDADLAALADAGKFERFAPRTFITAVSQNRI